MRNSRERRGTARTLGIVAGLLILAARSAAALDGESLRLLLLGAQDMNTPQVTMRADIAIALETHTGPRATRAIAFFAPGKDARWYLQLEDPALAALVRGAERKVMTRTAGSIVTSAIGEPIDDLGISYEDVSRFVADDFKLWQIADEGTDVVLAGGHPQVESAYVYRAYTFDKTRTIPLKVQFYAKTLNNLVKLRTDSDHILIGKKWFPGRIEIQNFLDNSKTTLTIRWSQAASVPPELLAPESFGGAAPVSWSTPVPAATTTP
ncbi:MAG: outer membrane lipoprotein-sorting protein [Deltaproteobacteria bacterium]|nr:outer membrane lipoprotein-sorting protein [Deltaproteobacteria bacterium]